MTLDWLTTALTEHKIPVGRTARLGFDWLRANASPLFDAVAAVLETLIAGFQTALELSLIHISEPTRRS